MKALPFLNSCHRVEGLSWAQWVTDEGKKPWAGKTALKGSQAEGKRLEKDIALKLQIRPQGLPAGFERVIYNPWIEFWDTSGHHFAQPDFVITGPEEILVLESKLSQSPFAFDQLWYLYKPLLEKMYPEKKIYLVQVARWLRCKWDPICWNLEEALELCRDPKKNIPILHYQGSI